MAEKHRKTEEHETAEFTPEELRKAKSTYDPSQLQPKAEGNPQGSGKPQPTHNEIAEQERLEDKAQEVDRDRKDRLVNVGRGQHTSGRMGGNS